MHNLPKKSGCGSTTTVTNGCNDPCNQHVISTDQVAYTGPNLGCTGINTCDSITVALQKINEQICDIWEVVNAFTTTSTTTSTSTSTTTSTTSTTTTAIPSYPFLMKVSTVSSTDACNNGIIGTYYSNSPTLGSFSFLTIDPQLQVAASNGFYCLAQGCPNPTGLRWVRLNSGNGEINQSAFC